MEKVKKEFINFLDEIKEKINSNELSDEKLELIFQFYIFYKFNSHEEQMTSENNYSEKDIIKFLTLGWWIYHNIEKNKN